MPKKRSSIDLVEPLKFWRAKRGYSQAKLAKQTNTSALTIGHLESGKRRARGKTLEKILKGLNLSEEEFFTMRPGGAPAAAKAPLAKPAESVKPVPGGKEGVSLRLSNLDLELLNRMLNLDFDGKIETLKFLQNLS